MTTDVGAALLTDEALGALARALAATLSGEEPTHELPWVAALVSALGDDTPHAARARARLEREVDAALTPSAPHVTHVRHVMQDALVTHTLASAPSASAPASVHVPPSAPAPPSVGSPGLVSATLERLMAGRAGLSLDATGGLDPTLAARPALPFAGTPRPAGSDPVALALAKMSATFGARPLDATAPLAPADATPAASPVPFTPAAPVADQRRPVAPRVDTGTLAPGGGSRKEPPPTSTLAPERYAQVSAELALEPSRAAVLARHGLDEASWRALSAPLDERARRDGALRARCLEVLREVGERLGGSRAR
jgi:hypothetical protein